MRFNIQAHDPGDISGDIATKGKLLKNPSGQILISWQTNSCSVLGFRSGKLWSLTRETVTVCVCVCTGGLRGVCLLVLVRGGLSIGFEQKCPIAAFWHPCLPWPSAHSSQGLLTNSGCSQHLIAMLMPRAASICNSSLEMVFRFPSSLEGWGCQETVFCFVLFFPASGQTGKINSAQWPKIPSLRSSLVWTEKQERGQVKIVIRLFAEDQEWGGKGQIPFTNLFSIVNFPFFVHNLGDTASTSLLAWGRHPLCLI